MILSDPGHKFGKTVRRPHFGHIARRGIQNDPGPVARDFEEHTQALKRTNEPFRDGEKSLDLLGRGHAQKIQEFEKIFGFLFFSFLFIIRMNMRERPRHAARVT